MNKWSFLARSLWPVGILSHATHGNPEASLRFRELVRTIDNYAPMPTYDVQRSVAGFPDGVHVLRIVVLGEGRPHSP